LTAARPQSKSRAGQGTTIVMALQHAVTGTDEARAS
jgi:hypothetical protein